MSAKLQENNSVYRQPSMNDLKLKEGEVSISFRPSSLPLKLLQTRTVVGTSSCLDHFACFVAKKPQS